MLTKVEMLKMLVGLKEVNDLDLVEDDAVLNASCSASDKPTGINMVSLGLNPGLMPICRPISFGFTFSLFPARNTVTVLQRLDSGNFFLSTPNLV